MITNLGPSPRFGAPGSASSMGPGGSYQSNGGGMNYNTTKYASTESLHMGQDNHLNPQYQQQQPIQQHGHHQVHKIPYASVELIHDVDP